MKSEIILAGVIGFLIGLIYCYSKQIQELNENKDVLASGAQAYSSVKDFANQIREKF